MAVGAVVGGVAGGLIGKGLAEEVNPSAETAMPAGNRTFPAVSRDSWDRTDEDRIPVAVAATRRPVTRDTAHPAKREISHDMIETRAYYIFKGGSGMSQDDNWFQAERELQASETEQAVGE